MLAMTLQHFSRGRVDKWLRNRPCRSFPASEQGTHSRRGARFQKNSARWWIDFSGMHEAYFGFSDLLVCWCAGAGPRVGLGLGLRLELELGRWLKPLQLATWYTRTSPAAYVDHQAIHNQSLHILTSSMSTQTLVGSTHNQQPAECAAVTPWHPPLPSAKHKDTTRSQQATPRYSNIELYRGPTSRMSVVSSRCQKPQYETRFLCADMAEHYAHARAQKPASLPI